MAEINGNDISSPNNVSWAAPVGPKIAHLHGWQTGVWYGPEIQPGLFADSLNFFPHGSLYGLLVLSQSMPNGLAE